LVNGLDAFSNFNQANFYLSNTSSGSSINFNIPTNTPVIKLTFQLSAACNLINVQDFSNITTLFDGDVSSYKFSAPITNSIQVISSLPTCSNNEIIFSYDSLYAGKPIQTYSWDFGNADFSNHQTDSTIYSIGGNYNITLDVVTNDGCSYTCTFPIEILEGPLASFTSAQGSTQSEVIFTNTSVFTAGTITQFHWDFGNGQTSFEENPIVTYLGADTYPVTLTVLADNGCENTTLVNVSTVGIDEKDMIHFTLSPNPANHIINVQSSCQLGPWSILNSQGQVVLKGNSNEINTAIDIKSLASGIYTMQFFSSIYMFMKY
jgi:PKD repeat protein